jgi:hypothetical protein
LQNAAGCDSTVTLNLTINILSIPDITGSISTCENSNELYSTSIIGAKYDWSCLGGQIVSGLQSSKINIDWGNAENGSVGLTVKNLQTGCSRSSSMEVKVNPVPKTGFALHSIEISKDVSIQANLSGLPNGLQFNLDPLGISGTIANSNVSFMPINSGMYYLTLSNGTCSVIDSLNVIVHCNVCENSKVIATFPGFLTHGCDYGYFYNDNTGCSWKLSDMYADTVYLRFDKFDIQHGDFLQIRNFYTNEIIYSFNNDNNPKANYCE